MGWIALLAIAEIFILAALANAYLRSTSLADRVQSLERWRERMEG